MQMNFYWFMGLTFVFVFSPGGKRPIVLFWCTPSALHISLWLIVLMKHQKEEVSTQHKIFNSSLHFRTNFSNRCNNRCSTKPEYHHNVKISVKEICSLTVNFRKNRNQQRFPEWFLLFYKDRNGYVKCIYVSTEVSTQVQIHLNIRGNKTKSVLHYYQVAPLCTPLLHF